MSNILALRNYSSQHIYKILSIKHSSLPQNEFILKLQIIFKELLNNIRNITTTIELDPFNTPMGFLFQHLKPDIIHLVANCSSKNDKLFLDRFLLMDYNWNLRLFNVMKILNAKDIMVWFFLQVPYYNQTQSSIGKFRVLYEQLLDYFLLNWDENYYLTEEEFIFISNETCMPYALSYHNKNNVDILVKYCKLIRKICPWINYYSPRLAEKILNNTNHNNYPHNNHSQNVPLERGNTSIGKKRICFISDAFNTDSSVLRDRISIIGKLDRSRYDIAIASFNPISSVQGIIAKTFMERFKENYIYLGYQGNQGNHSGSILTNARMILEKYNFDYIVYADLGMKLLPTLLAYSRIAMTQITTWGHSETSGINTIDYYVSSEWFELPANEAQSHYSERLILFKSLGTFYISPNKLFIENNVKWLSQNKTFKTKLELGFKTDNNIYCCLQTFYKINEEFERCVARILELDPNGIILLSNSFPYCKSHLARMMGILGDEKIQRLRWYPSLDKPEFLNLVQIADVCLDPFPFGGCNTSYDAFDYNVPVITLPSEFLHGRFTYGLYKKMDLADIECIVANTEQYARIATEICINVKLRHKINRNIEMRKHLIFQEQASVDEWNELFAKQLNQ